MVQFDIPVALGIGGVFADAAREQLKTGEPAHYYRTLTRNLLFFIVFASWLPIYLLVMYFGFETSHMWWHADSVTAYPAFIPVFVPLYFLANVAGFVIGTRLIRAGRVGTNRALIAAAVVYSLGWVFLQPGRTLVLGSHADWAAGTAPPVTSDGGLLTLLGVSALAFNVAIVVAYRRIRSEGRGLSG